MPSPANEVIEISRILRICLVLATLTALLIKPGIKIIVESVIAKMENNKFLTKHIPSLAAGYKENLAIFLWSLVSFFLLLLAVDTFFVVTHWGQ